MSYNDLTFEVKINFDEDKFKEKIKELIRQAKEEIPSTYTLKSPNITLDIDRTVTEEEINQLLDTVARFYVL